MHIRSFPHCCTARVLCHLGGTHTDEDGYTEYTKGGFMKEIKQCIGNQQGGAFVVATTTTDQEDANEWLQGYGFLCAGPYEKRNHPESGLYLWWYPVKGVYGEEG